MLCSLLIKSTHINIQQVRSATCVWQLLKRRYFNNDVPGARSVAAGTQNTFTGHIKRDFSLDVRLRDNVKSNEKVRGQGSVSRSQGEASKVSAAKKVKEAGRDFTYLIVVIIGIGVTGGLLYVVFKELLSSSSPSKIYGKALEKCRAHPEVVGAFGEPIKGYGEATRRGRRQQVSHVEYIKDGLKHMRLKFYIEGSEPRLQGTVHTEMKENPETGKYEFRYIFVDVDSYPRRTIVVEDNR